MNRDTIRIVLALGVILALALALAPRAALAGEDLPGGNSYPCKEFHTVRSGETLFTIARKYDVPALQLIVMNQLENANLIYPGEEMCVKFFKTAGAFYAVESGDTFSQIAKDYEVDPKFLAFVNGIDDPNVIFQGQLLFIPRGYKLYR
jgi:murein DD-endopeptidase MepM/ murein hydrolase activator NlpD